MDTRTPMTWDGPARTDRTDLASLEADIAARAAELKALRAAARKERHREYIRRPEVKERQREYMREYIRRPEVKLRNKLRRAGLTPEQIAVELAREAAE
jgi:hypothetical protein